MQIEILFSKLEQRTSVVFKKIRVAVTEGRDHIDLLEKDIQVLFKFMNVSPRRSVKYRDDVMSPYRDNDFMFQKLFESSRKRGRSGDPIRFWLDDLLYLLETSHEDLLEDAERNKETSSAATYKHLAETYTLQIWKAAEGREFFLNERLIDFEGDTQSFLGAEVADAGSQLLWMTAEDMIHMILPISPEVAIIFCDESRCWESPFADTMHRLKIPYPQNSLLKNAPHKDIININMPSQKRGKKTHPATTAWRVNIGTLSRQQHRIITCYSLLHAETCIVLGSRARFEKARRELEEFISERNERWTSQGVRFGCPVDRKQDEGNLVPPTKEQVTRMVDRHVSALDNALDLINNMQEEFPITKEMALMSWRAVRTLEMSLGGAAPSQEPPGMSTHLGCMPPALKIAFEAAYPPKHPDYRDLVEVDFGEFFNHCIGEISFAPLSQAIYKKMSDLVSSDTCTSHWEAAENIMTLLKSLAKRQDYLATETSIQQTKDLIDNPAFKSIVKGAELFSVLKWMFEERQDILGTFVLQISEPMEAMQRPVVRMRGRRV